MKVDKTYEYVICDDWGFMDSRPMLHIIYIINNKGIYFLCPCGCETWLCLKHDKWRYEIIKDKVSLSPSIHVILPCDSHFFIKHGKVKWC